MDGTILLVDKPPGITSRACDNIFQKIFATKRVGHFGTLDPMSSGLLPIFIGQATKLIPLLPSGPKEYEGVIRFGRETDSCDQEGKVVAKADPPLRATEVSKAFQQFLGEHDFLPPIYSAVKFKGRPLYYYARRGIEVELEARRSTIYTIDKLHYQRPDLAFRLSCSGGTYVRSIARDLGRSLNSVAYLQQLRRTINNPFQLKMANKLEQLKELSAAKLLKDYALSPQQVINLLPQVEISRARLKRISKGTVLSQDNYQLVEEKELNQGQALRVALKSANISECFGVGEIDYLSEENGYCLRILKIIV